MPHLDGISGKESFASSAIWGERKGQTQYIRDAANNYESGRQREGAGGGEMERE